ncbi:MFS transporter permease [Leucobacter sp. GX24907]
MWLRRAFFRWLFPAIVVLPLWLLFGWGVFKAGGWAFFWVLFIAIPSVGIAQLVLTLLVRARPSVIQSRMLSWWDVAGFGIWHLLTVLVGFFSQDWFSITLVGAIMGGLGVFWLALWQLRNELQHGPGVFLNARTETRPSFGSAGFGSAPFDGSGSQTPNRSGHLQADAPPGWGDAATHRAPNEDETDGRAAS